MKQIGYTFIYTVEKLGVGLKTMEKWLAAAILRHKRDKNIWIYTFEITFFQEDGGQNLDNGEAFENREEVDSELKNNSQILNGNDNLATDNRRSGSLSSLTYKNRFNEDIEIGNFFYNGYVQ